MSEQKYVIQRYSIIRPDAQASFQLFDLKPLNVEVILKRQRGVKEEIRRQYPLNEDSLIKTLVHLEQDFIAGKTGQELKYSVLAALWETKSLTEKIDVNDINAIHKWLTTAAEYNIAHPVLNAMQNIRNQGIDAGRN